MAERHIAEQLTVNHNLFYAVGLVVAGHISRYLANSEPFILKYFVSEIIAASLIGVGVYAYSITQGIDFGYIIVACVFMGLGVTRSLELVLKLLAAIRSSL